MTDKRISELDTSTPEGDDELVVARGAVENFKYTVTAVQSFLANFFAPLSHVSDQNNPHNTTALQVGADPAGSAGAVQNNLDTHIADAGDPHAAAGYLTQGETDLLYAPLTHVGSKGAINHAVFDDIAEGFVPASGGGIVNFLRADGTWAEPSGSGQSNTSTTPAAVGANEADINMPKAGVDLPKRKLVGGANVTLTQGADSITIAAAAGGGGTATFITTHTFAIAGDLATGATLRHFVSVPAGQTVALAKARHELASASSSCTIDVQINDTPAAGFIGIVVDDTPGNTDPANIPLSDDWSINLNIQTLDTGTPNGLSFTIYLEHAVTVS